MFIKGIKNSYVPFQNWYHQIYFYSEYFINLIESEFLQKNLSVDRRQAEIFQNYFNKVMNVVTLGCFSRSDEVNESCLKFLNQVAADFKQKSKLNYLLRLWMLEVYEGTSGVHSLVNVAKRKPEFVP